MSNKSNTDGHATPIGVQEYERLVKKLRHQLSNVSDDNMDLDKRVVNLQSEVERLRDKLAEAKEQANRSKLLFDAIDKLEAERDSLREQAKEQREALEDLYSHAPDEWTLTPETDFDNTFKNAILKAKAVLEKYKQPEQ